MLVDPISELFHQLNDHNQLLDFVDLEIRHELHQPVQVVIDISNVLIETNIEAIEYTVRAILFQQRCIGKVRRIVLGPRIRFLDDEVGNGLKSTLFVGNQNK